MSKITYSKENFITRQLQRTHNKRFENYALTRIWHGINSIDIKMVTQQYVILEKGCALLDAYFPQFNIGIEVDESHHFIEENITADKIRQKDVIRALNCVIYRIDVTLPFQEIHEQCDRVIQEIRTRMLSDKFEPWNLEEEFSEDKYIRNGFMTIGDNPIFRRQVDVLKCFGIYYKATWTGGENHPILDKVFIWFPKMYGSKEWINEFNYDETVIYEHNIDPIKNKEVMEQWLHMERSIRYVFVYAKDSLGRVLYRFKGVYQLDYEETKNRGKAVWCRISDRVDTIDEVLKGKKV